MQKVMQKCDHVSFPASQPLFFRVFFWLILDLLVVRRWSPNVFHDRWISRLETLSWVFREAAELHQLGEVAATQIPRFARLGRFGSEC